MRRISFPTWLLLVGLPACAPKRIDMPTSIPVPLASALIDDRGSPMSPSPVFTVGQLPRGYPTALVPTGPVRVVGGMTRANQTVVVFADSTRRLAAVMEQVFEQHGYSRPKPIPASGFSPASGPYSSFCGDSGVVSAEPLAGANRSLVRVTYQREFGNPFCRQQTAPSPGGELVLPELKPPPGMRVASAGGSGGSDEINANAEITGTDLDPSTIVAYYAAQLVSASWSAAPPANSNRVAAQYFSAKDTSRGPWEGVLVASGGDTAVTISLTMHRQRSE